MTAVGSLNLSASNIVNSGMIRSAADINIASQSILQNLNIAGSGGTFSAAGVINVTTGDVVAKLNTNIIGGDFIAQALNVDSGNGVLNLNAGQIAGILNVKAGEAHIAASTEHLVLGSFELSGDPTFYNHGDVTIGGNMIFSGAPLAIVAGGNIRTTAGAGIISTASTSGSGGELTLVAGANFTSSGSNCCVTPGGAGDTTSILTILGPSATGGSIDLSSGGGITSFSSASTGGGGNGGTIRLVAFANADPSSGKILLPSSVGITSGGNGSGQDGSVTMIAGATSGAAISVGSINTTGGGTLAPINVSSGNTSVAGGGACAPCLTIVNGQVTGGSFSLPSGVAALSAGTIATGDLSGGAVTVQSNGAIATGSIIANGLAGNPGESITVFSQSTVTLNGSSISANAGSGSGDGGSISITGSSLNMPNHVAATVDASGAGKGGQFALSLSSSAATFGLLAGQLSISASGGSSGSSGGDGGSVTVTANSGSLTINPGGLTVDPRGLNGKGGAVTVSANHLKVNGSLITDGAGTGNGGIIDLTNLAPFSISSAATPDGVTGKLSASAGSISGSGGRISVQASGDINLGDASAIDVHATYGNGGVIILETVFFGGGRIVVPGGGTLSVDAKGEGNGGQFSLFLDSFNITGPAPLNFSANGAGNGNGGSFSTTALSSTIPVVVGKGPGQLTYSATGGSAGSAAGNAGFLSISNATDVTLDPAAIDLRPLGLNGNAGSVHLVAGFFNIVFGSNSNVKITGALHLDGVGTGNGGLLQIMFQGANTFNVNANTANSINGAFSGRSGPLGGTGGGFSVTSISFGGGGASINSWSDVDVSTTNGSGGFIGLSTNGNIVVPSGIIDMSAVGAGNYNGGSVRLATAGSVTFIGGGPVILKADATGNGDGGSVSFQHSGNVNIGGGPGQIQMFARGGSPGSAAGNGGFAAASGGGGVDDIFIDPAFFRAEPLGLNGNGARINLASRNIAYAGSLNVDGVGTGNGGTVSFQAQSNSPLVVGVPSGNGIAGSLTARGGAAGGNGGQIYISSLGSSGLDLRNALVSVAATNGHGGSLTATTVNFNSSTLSLNAATVLSANAGGSGQFNGGSVDITVRRYAVSAGAPATITANAAGTGNGGRISFTTVAAGQDLSVGAAARLLLSATGGSAGSASGNGGTISLTSSTNLFVNTAGISAKPLGMNGDGATITFTSGQLATNNFQVTGNILADSVGAGKGGSITLNYADAVNPLTIGSATGTSFVNGMISAAAANGAGGTITVRNSLASAPISVNLTGTVSAAGSLGSGTVDIGQANQAVTISGGGKLLANLVSAGSSLQVNLTAGDLSIKSATSTSGNTVLAASGSIKVIAGGSVNSAGSLTATAPLVSIAGQMVAAGNISISTDTLINNGIIIVNNPSGQINVNAAGALALNGSGVFRIAGGTAGSIGFTAGGVNTLTLNGSYAFDPGANGLTLIKGATLLVADCAVETLITGNSLILDATNLTLGANAYIHSLSTGANITLQSSTGNLIISLPGGGSFAEITTTGGDINFKGATGQQIVLPSAPGGSTLKANTGGAALFSATSTGGMQIASGLTLTTDSSATFNIDGGAFDLSGTVSSSHVGGTIQIQSLAGDLSVQGGGSLSFLSNGANTINFIAPAGSSMNMLSSLSLAADPGAGGNGKIVISSDKLNLGANVTLASPLAFADAMRVNSNLISLAAGSTASLQASSILITPNSGTTILFDSPGPGVATLNLNNNATIQAGTITIQPTVRLSSNGALALQPGATLTVQGAVTAPVVNVVINSDLLIAGNGSLTSTTGGANAISLSVTGAHTLSLSGSLTLDTSAGGTASLNAAAAGASISVGGNSSLTIANGMLAISTPSLILNDLSTILAPSITIDSGAANNDLTVTLSAGATSGFSSTVGNINFAPSGTGAFSIVQGGAGSTLNVSGPMNVTTAGANITVGAGVTLASDNNIVFNVNGGTFTNDGSISTSAPGGALAVQSSSTLVLAGSGSLSTTSNGANTITFSIAGANNLVLNPDFSIDAGANGKVNFNAKASGASISLPGNSVNSIANGMLNLSTPTLSFGADSSLSASSISIDSGSPTNDIVIVSTGTNTVTTGLLSLNPLAGHSITFSSIGPAATLNVTGAPINVTTSGASGNVAINAGTTVASNNSVTLNINGGTFTNNGALTTSAAGGSVNVQSTSSLALNGSGLLSATGGGASVVGISGVTVSFGGNQQLDAGTGGSALISATSTLTFTSGNQSVAGNAPLTVTSPIVNFGNGAQLSSAAGGVITLNSSADQTLGVAAGGVSTISSPTGTIALAPSGKLSVTTNGAGTGTLQLDTPSLALTATSATIGANSTLNSTGNQSLSLADLANNGTLSAAGSITLQDNTGVTVTGTGTIAATALTANSTNGFVSLSQGAITSPLTGTAALNYTVTTVGGALTVGSLTSGGGAVSVTNNGGSLTITDGSSISAFSNVSLTGTTALNIGTTGAVTVQAGMLGNAFNPLSTNMTDYDLSAFTSPGSVTFRTTAGTMTVSDNLSVTAAGGSIGFSSAGNLTMGSNETLFAQGGNVWLNAFGDISIGGGTFSAVARGTPGQIFFPGANTILPNYQGGNIAIDANVLQPSYDSYLRSNFDVNRVTAGSQTISAGVTTPGTTLSYSNGGMLSLVATGIGAINVIGSTLSADGAVIHIDPPGAVINISNLTLTAIGPALTGGTAPPIVAGTTTATALAAITTIKAPAIIVADTEDIQSTNQGLSARSVPLDTIRFSVGLSSTTPATNTQACTTSSEISFANDNDTTGWSVASGHCQPFSIQGNEGTMLVGRGGTSVGPGKDNSLNLAEGKLVAVTSKTPLVVATLHGEVTLPANSAMIIEETSSGVMRVTNLGGASDTTISVSSHGDTHTITAMAGQEIIVADRSTSEEELIPIDGVERLSVGAKLEVGTLQLRKNSINRAQLLNADNLLSCPRVCIPFPMRARLKDLSRDVQSQQQSRLPSASNPIRPIAFATPAVSPTVNIKTIQAGGNVLKHASGTDFEMSTDNILRLRHGELLISAKRPIVVVSDCGSVEVKKGAIALITKKNGALCAATLWESSPGSVEMLTGGRRVAIAPGSEMVAAERPALIDAMLKSDPKARRRVVRTTLPGGQGILTSEMSFVSMFVDSQLISEVFKSGEDTDRQVSSRMAKMAVALTVVTAKHGGYSVVNPTSSRDGKP